MGVEHNELCVVEIYSRVVFGHFSVSRLSNTGKLHCLPPLAVRGAAA
ncbi:hypothetical protein BN2497_1967 [Janthinobacterium sp. CG23_2]|nr:hypothetical protein BN2497_1967 [Janthinobacterium sp. CG23_2]CUU27381.1 hypothetical protein BN3177_1967 [Janthinobacterium sp. CG23_2]